MSGASDEFGQTAPATDLLAELLGKTSQHGLQTLQFHTGDCILQANLPNDILYVILQGTAGLYKDNADGGRVLVDRLLPGSFLGLLSFWTGEPSFTESVALEDLQCIRIPRNTFRSLVDTDRDFARQMQQLFITNLTQRYRRLVHLNLQVDVLTRDLQRERNDLQQAISDLESTRSRLVHQEKLATMGQLLAGIAHEMNNPASSLLKSLESLSSQIPAMVDAAASGPVPHAVEFLNAGQQSPFLDSAVTRSRMEEVEAAYPAMRRSLVRRVAQMEPQLRQLLHKQLQQATRDDTAESRLLAALRHFEAGASLRTARSSTERIVRLVKSLKNYGRQDGATAEELDLRDCIQDTLVILNHRLKDFELQLDLGAAPRVWCQPGEINQVLTNLLVNACEATPAGGSIRIQLAENADGAQVAVADSGHGVPLAALDRIFEPNFTTKNRSGEFGLGLGLAISSDIIHKHGGSIHVESEPGKGARFWFWLPRVSRSHH